MICTECGKTIEFYSAELEAIQDAIVAKHKFRPTQHSLRIFGVCAQCQRTHNLNPHEESAAEPRMRFTTAPNTQ
jgi:Fur family ferric uptake transcriptional regulator